MKGSKYWRSYEKDPFMVSCLYKEQYMSAMELAFQIHKQERALHILEATKGMYYIFRESCNRPLRTFKNDEMNT